MTRTIIVAAAVALAAVLPAVSAQAQAPRTFVSAAGSDSNPCSFAAPCRHFQAAVNATSAGGEVDALDPAGYGPITITQAITIEGQGWSYIAPPPGGNGITINAVSGNVSIHGVSLNGAGITGGTNGIVFNSGDSLTVTDCVVQNFIGNSAFNGNGILMEPASGTFSFVITNTNVSNDGFFGIHYVPTGAASATGTIDHVVATNEMSGIVIDTTESAGTTKVAISNSIASNNSNDGIGIGTLNATLQASIDNCSISGNGTGVDVESSAEVEIGRSVITLNVTGVQNGTSPAGAFSYQDNRIHLNTTTNISRALSSLSPD